MRKGRRKRRNGTNKIAKKWWQRSGDISKKAVTPFGLHTHTLVSFPFEKAKEGSTLFVWRPTRKTRKQLIRVSVV